jgi:hypothetical protein
MIARAYHRILKLAQTIADLAGCEGIETVHLAETIQYRVRRQTLPVLSLVKSYRLHFNKSLEKSYRSS